jgi:DNA-3-methyladenine glycosylase II
MVKTFSKSTCKKHCDVMRRQHAVIERLHQLYGYPPFWKRSNSFESLCKTIIEQQVSLASAKSVYNRLKEYTGAIAPAQLAALSTEEYRTCGITRQKSHYLTLLAIRVLQEPDFFTSLEKMNDQAVKEKLMSLKGIGHWTANVYMLVALNRLDIYPDFDVALINSIAYEIFEGEKINNETARNYMAQFSPMQSIPCLYFYHAYIVRRKVVFVP